MRRIFAVLVIALASAASASSCYLSDSARFGTPIEVVVGTIRPGGDWVTGPSPATGAYVVAERCHDHARSEARVESSGFAWLDFDRVECWTVTVVSADRSRAVSFVRAPAPLDGPVLLAEPALPSFPTNRVRVTGSVPAARGADHEVTIEVGAVASEGLLGVCRVDVSGATFDGTCSLERTPRVLHLVAIEWDADDRPVDGVVLSATRTSAGAFSFDVRWEDSAVAIRETALTLTLPSTGAFSLDDLRASAGRTRSDRSYYGWTMGATVIEPAGDPGHAAIRRIRVLSPELVWPKETPRDPELFIALHREEDVLASYVGAVRVQARQVEALTIPPADVTRLGGTSLTTLDVEVGGAGHFGWVMIHPGIRADFATMSA